MVPAFRVVSSVPDYVDTMVFSEAELAASNCPDSHRRGVRIVDSKRASKLLRSRCALRIDQFPLPRITSVIKKMKRAQFIAQRLWLDSTLWNPRERHTHIGSAQETGVMHKGGRDDRPEE